MTFEEQIRRLDEIVRSLESGNAPLDDAIKLFDEGVKLAASCNKTLDGAEQRIRQINTGGNGQNEGETVGVPGAG